MKLLIAAVLILKLSVTVQARAFGAPAEACPNIFPEGHTNPANTADTTVSFIISSNFPGGNGTYYYCPERKFNLTLASNTSLPFRGLLVQARNMMNVAVGSFSNFDLLTEQSACTPPESAVTHSVNTNRMSQELTWTAPPVGTGPIKFLYAVVVAFTPNVFNRNYATLETFNIQEGVRGTEFCMSSSTGLTTSLLTLLAVSVSGILLH